MRRPNPLLSLPPGFDVMVSTFLARVPHEFGFDITDNVVWPTGRGGNAPITIDPVNKRILVTRGWNTPTLAHLLVEIDKEAPSLRRFQLYDYGDFGRHTSLGMTLHGAATNMTVVRQEGKAHPFSRDAKQKKQKKAWFYHTDVLFRDRVFYHATLASRWRSISRVGLRASSLRSTRVVGWSPGWNWNLQHGVYLTLDPAYALDIAKELTARTRKQSIVLAVTGDWVEDDTRLMPDEDSIRNDYTGELDPCAIDGDFPPWVTGAESKIQSIVYLGSIRPAYVSPWARVSWSPLEYWRYDQKITEPGFVVTGSRDANELDKGEE